ncbi:MAG: hypothetical protein WBQ75_19560 [Acetobacteraceae bacterium]
MIGRTYDPMPFYGILGTLIYLAINYSLSSASRHLEARFAYVWWVRCWASSVAWPMAASPCWSSPTRWAPRAR